MIDDFFIDEFDLRLRECALRSRKESNIIGDKKSLGSTSHHDIRLIHFSDCSMDEYHLCLRCRELHERRLECFERSSRISLEDDLELLESTRLESRHEHTEGCSFECVDGFFIFREGIILRTCRSKLTRRYDLKDISSLYYIRETCDLYGNSRKCCFDISSFIVFERSDFS